MAFATFKWDSLFPTTRHLIPTPPLISLQILAAKVLSPRRSCCQFVVAINFSCAIVLHVYLFGNNRLDVILPGFRFTRPRFSRGSFRGAGHPLRRCACPL